MWFFDFSTMAANRAPDAGGIWSQHTVWAGNSIVAANEGGNCGGPGGAFAAVSDDHSCGGRSEGDAGLLALTTINGAPVHPISSDSPAVDHAGEPINAGGEWCGSFGPADQAGTIRPLDGDGDGIALCDAGAFEAAAVAPNEPSPRPLPNTAVAQHRVDSEPTNPVWILALAGLIGLCLARRLQGR